MFDSSHVAEHGSDDAGNLIEVARQQAGDLVECLLDVAARSILGTELRERKLELLFARLDTDPEARASRRIGGVFVVIHMRSPSE
ncbi:MAG: hypothetical protein E6J90_42895 [Deltaproteobacteria bacterium]|nr:MAG: hypothetical protein E6J91_38380 [Deltaproteobacteria bacterium]TMQ07684.1 MAG: hypothetical protein E6J90_42895 [Deltaproteobacteria bacterium]